MSDNKFDIDELIKIAKIPTESKEEKNYLSEAHTFAVHYNIEPGTYKVRSAVVYELYKKWKKGKNIQTKTKFFTDFSKIFTKHHDGSYVYYLLDATPFHLSDPIYSNIKNPIKRENSIRGNSDKKRKNIKKKQR